ncbi:hypothetical protein Q5113_06935 [Acinetobacter pittii]|uniref:hypothetical protein n=1 Tax=Acinetobacter pittii TaxID=48296 RepID=UPI0026FB83E5|nr:hypothetical protein [Acinetobacter pittii]MDO7535297.1 hypothetical protein [Acinetobacter pittii]
MIEFYCSNDGVRNLIEDYWKSEEIGNYVYTLKYLLSKYNFKTPSALETIIKKNSYGFINQEQYLCPECRKPHKFLIRGDLKNFYKKYSNICKECEVKNTEERLILEFNLCKDPIFSFNKIYNANLNNNYSDDYCGIFDNLEYIEFIYLYVILTNNEPNHFGKLGAKKFPLFLHKEFYKNNKYLKKLSKKSLLFYTLGLSSLDSIRYINFYQSFYKNDLSSEIKEMLSELKDKRTDFFNIIFKPKGYSQKQYESFLLNKINSYELNLEMLENLSNFLKNIRRMEVLFIVDVVEYNTDFKLLKDNGVDFKLDILQESYSLKEIYGYLNSTVNFTLYKLDTLPDSQRKKIKNKIYTNIFKSEKEKIFFKKNLPRNYRKSDLLEFIEKNYELDCDWVDVPIDVFLKSFFSKLENLGRINI